jgi:hypothetical protein
MAGSTGAVMTPVGACNGTGNCTQMAQPACNYTQCVGTACATTCATDNDCVSGRYCDATGHCVTQKANGSTCNDAAGADCEVAGCRECSSGGGHCVDGVCCNRTSANCNGDCQRCDTASTMGKGNCGPAVAGTPGRMDCMNNLECNGTSTSCPTACINDTTCATGFYCKGTNPNPSCAAANVASGGKCDCEVAGCHACAGGGACDAMDHCP